MTAMHRTAAAALCVVLALSGSALFADGAEARLFARRLLVMHSLSGFLGGQVPVGGVVLRGPSWGLGAEGG